MSGNAAMAMFSGVIRKAFFVDAHDIGSLDVLLDLANEAGFSTQDIEGQLRSGQATASLSTDLRTAAAAGIKGSPTWVLKGGRQVLSGNVGYRILSANIEELLHGGINQASWC